MKGQTLHKFCTAPPSALVLKSVSALWEGHRSGNAVSRKKGRVWRQGLTLESRAALLSQFPQRNPGREQGAEGQEAAGLRGPDLLASCVAFA